MECPKCGGTIDTKGLCINCRADINVYVKTQEVSLRLYNKGLEQANIGDFSSAMQTLNKSIKFNKSNYLARNVLGLVYYQTGEISNALKQWIISNSFAKANNSAKEYIDNIQNNSEKFEKYNNSIKMYNQALIYANQKSEDMAIIQLKKALELNPNFLEAFNLLALCYISIGENDKALLCIDKALEIDISNPKALKYYNEIRQFTQSNMKVDKVAKTNQNTKHPPKTQESKKINLKGQAFGQLTGFIGGAVVIAIVMFVLVFPGIKSGYAEQNKQYEQQNKDISKQLDDLTTKYNETVTKLQEENNKLTQDNDALSNQLKTKEQIQKVQQISTFYDSGNKEEAFNLLQSLTQSYESFPEETKVLYNSLRDKILPDMAKIYYDDGMKKYNSRSYDEARVLLEKSFSIMTDQSFSDDALYYMARIDEINKNIESAKTLYQKLMDDYPKSNQFYYARTRLANLA